MAKSLGVAMALSAGCTMIGAKPAGPGTTTSGGSTAGPVAAGGAGRCGTSTGTYSLAPPIAFPSKRADGGIAVGDLNGDGYPDIVTGNDQKLDDNTGELTIGVLIKKHDGTFEPIALYKTIEYAHAYSIALADL